MSTDKLVRQWWGKTLQELDQEGENWPDSPQIGGFKKNKNGGRLEKKVNISPLLKRTLECFFLNYDYYYCYYCYCFWIPPLISLQSNPPSKRFIHVAQCIIWGGE